jgi:hypothetical protein
MRYMLLIYSGETEESKLTAEDFAAMRAAHWSVMDETSRLGIFRGAEPLRPTRTATTVRMHDGKAVITDGPFAETKEQLAGYYILDCKDLDEVIAWAAKIPTGCKGANGSVEIRPLEPVPQPSDPEFQALRPQKS